MKTLTPGVWWALLSFAGVGLSRMSVSGRSVINFSGSVDSRGNVGLAAGFGVHW